MWSYVAIAIVSGLQAISSLNGDTVSLTAVGVAWGLISPCFGQILSPKDRLKYSKSGRIAPISDDFAVFGANFDVFGRVSNFLQHVLPIFDNHRRCQSCFKRFSATDCD
jgi:hypothetical protein